MSWDWLLDGTKPEKRTGELAAWTPEFDWKEINKRFLSLFDDMSQAEIAELLEVTPGAVSSWKNDRRHNSLGENEIWG